jgi:hypothetical protein
LCFDCPEEFALNVSQEAEMTVPQYLRKIRMERAGELSPTGKFIVSTARTVVGEHLDLEGQAGVVARKSAVC